MEVSDDAIDEEIDNLVNRLSQHGHELLERRLRPYDLTIPQFQALKAINKLSDEATMTAVGNIIQAPPSSMTSIVDRLARSGLVERDHPPHNRRAVVARTTTQGSIVVREVEAQGRQDLSAMLSGMSYDERKQFVAILRKLINGIETLLSEI